MSRLQFRGSIAGAAVVVALLWPGPADAQVGVDPGPPREPGGLVNDLASGVYYDVLNQALAEKRLQKLQAKLRRDAERGDSAAMDHDARQIGHVKYRIVIDEWLIRWNSRHYADFYPIFTDSVSCAAIAQATHPTQVPDALRQVPTPVSMAAAPTTPITIVNAESTGDAVTFTIDGVAHQAPANSRQELAVAPNSTITYDAGGSLGRRTYRISQGFYEFRSTAEGWAIYKIAGMP